MGERPLTRTAAGTGAEFFSEPPGGRSLRPNAHFKRIAWKPPKRSVERSVGMSRRVPNTHSRRGKERLHAEGPILPGGRASEPCERRGSRHLDRRPRASCSSLAGLRAPGWIGRHTSNHPQNLPPAIAEAVPPHAPPAPDELEIFQCAEDRHHEHLDECVEGEDDHPR
jgi:hypothetical protein